MSVNTNDSLNIGQHTVIIQFTYLSSLGSTVWPSPITWVLNVLKETVITPIDPCSKTIISKWNKLIPDTIEVTLTKLFYSPKNFTLPKLIDSYSESLSKF
jgi:hypothetical protein